MGGIGWIVEIVREIYHFSHTCIEVSVMSGIAIFVGFQSELLVDILRIAFISKVKFILKVFWKDHT